MYSHKRYIVPLCKPHAHEWMWCSRIKQHIWWVGINGKHTSHHKFILQNLLSLSKVDLSRAAYGHLFLDNHPLDQTGVGWRLGRLRRLVLWTLLSIVALLATLETSTGLVPLSLTWWDLLSLGLLLLLLYRLMWQNLLNYRTHMHLSLSNDLWQLCICSW